MGLLVLYSTLAIPTAMSEECGKVRRGARPGLAEIEEKGWVPGVSRAQDQGHSPAASTFGSNRVSSVRGRTESSWPSEQLLCPVCAECAPLCAVPGPKSGSGKLIIELRNTQGMIIADPQRVVC